jgi:hypothetical protein
MPPELLQKLKIDLPLIIRDPNWFSKKHNKYEKRKQNKQLETKKTKTYFIFYVVLFVMYKFRQQHKENIYYLVQTEKK